jgi:hypothetical protein
VLPKPDRDEAYFVACKTFDSMCAPDVGEKFSEAYCDAQARLEQPRFADDYKCITDQACHPTVACLTPSEPGTLGTETCRRAASCGKPCRPAQADYSSDEDYLNAMESRLRPSIVAVARQCIAEATCEKFIACNDALGYLWQLSWHNYSGT